MVNKVSTFVYAPVFRGSFPSLITPRAYTDPTTKKVRGAPKFRLEMIFKDEDMGKFKVRNEENEIIPNQKLTSILMSLCDKKWHGQDVKEVFPLNKKGWPSGWPIKTGDKIAKLREDSKKNGDHYKGMQVVTATASNEYPPRLLYLSTGGKPVELDRDNEEDAARIKEFFGNGGHYYVGELNIVAQETEQGNFLTVYMNAICFVRKGQKLGGGSVAERFDGIYGGESDMYDPTEEDFNMDEEAPF